MCNSQNFYFFSSKFHWIIFFCACRKRFSSTCGTSFFIFEWALCKNESVPVGSQKASGRGSESSKEPLLLHLRWRCLHGLQHCGSQRGEREWPGDSTWGLFWSWTQIVSIYSIILLCSAFFVVLMFLAIRHPYVFSIYFQELFQANGEWDKRRRSRMHSCHHRDQYCQDELRWGSTCLHSQKKF